MTIRIVVDTPEEKASLLKASEHIRFSDVDTDIPGVNFLSHLFMYPASIEVTTSPDHPNPIPPHEEH